MKTGERSDLSSSGKSRDLHLIGIPLNPLVVRSSMPSNGDNPAEVFEERQISCVAGVAFNASRPRIPSVVRCLLASASNISGMSTALS